MRPSTQGTSTSAPIRADRAARDSCTTTPPIAPPFQSVGVRSGGTSFRGREALRHGAGCDRRGCGHLPSVDFEDLYRVTYPRVLAYARSMASREDADDAVAETYAIAWRRQRDIPHGAELAWLIGVTRRVLANARRT